MRHCDNKVRYHNDIIWHKNDSIEINETGHIRVTIGHTGGTWGYADFTVDHCNGILCHKEGRLKHCNDREGIVVKWEWRRLTGHTDSTIGQSCGILEHYDDTIKIHFRHNFKLWWHNWAPWWHSWTPWCTTEYIDDIWKQCSGQYSTVKINYIPILSKINRDYTGGNWGDTLDNIHGTSSNLMECEGTVMTQ